MREALHGEWTKLRTVPSTGGVLLALLILTVAGSATAVCSVTCRTAGCGYDAVKLSLAGVKVGQALAAILAVSVVGDEYRTGSIRTTLTAVPRRATLLASKAVLVSGLVVAVGTVAVVASLVVSRRLLPARGFTAAHGYPFLSLADAPTRRAALGTVLYLMLVTLLSLGVAMIVRSSAAAIGVLLGLLYLLPVIVAVVSDPDWHRRLWMISPANAGLALQATTSQHSLPVGAWAGLGLLTVWSATAITGAAVLLRVRDV